MPLCDTLLRLAEGSSLYRPFWSDRILEEVGKALQEKLGQRRVGPSQEGDVLVAEEVPANPIQADCLGCRPRLS